ncbi:hypothetical protein HAX54_010429 [Datura stramonium]|uniref:Uncharacterized protein n=1 Tax=Datura stramonium TaxID=4076 RepID=A0ABS8WYL3_DATST|nr:hypothetical protein [Datura stramonium]
MGMHVGLSCAIRKALRRSRTVEMGRIICLSMSLEVAFRLGYWAYTTSKVTMEAMVKILANKLKGTGITVNYMASKTIATELFYDGNTEEIINRVTNDCPHGRLGLSKDIMPVVGFLAGDTSK